MKLIILRNDCNGQMLPISEGIVEIRINSQPCKGINLTTRYTQARMAPRVATIHNVTKNSGQVSPRPSAVFRAYASADTPWVARTLSHYTSVMRGKVSFNSSTHEATQFVGPHKIPYAPVHNSNLLIGARRSVLNRHRWGLPPWSSEYQIRSDHSPSFPSSIFHFPLIAPLGLILNHSNIYSSFQHSFHDPGYQKALNLASGVCHSTSTRVLSTKHSITNGFSTTIGLRWYTKV
jgi:hypothetical protein